MWFKGSNSYIGKVENFAYGEINERSFSNPHPCIRIIQQWALESHVIHRNDIILRYQYTEQSMVETIAHGLTHAKISLIKLHNTQSRNEILNV